MSLEKRESLYHIPLQKTHFFHPWEIRREKAFARATKGGQRGKENSADGRIKRGEDGKAAD
jgi:hypothetical protein